ncbi:energy-coupling factor transporter transmembrane component T family protein [Methanolobus sp. WCC5]|uniref:energy-coupling factor transporter transmembrane component T family protein n=1 Tax=Methanolobus sp. WCC5 TaxID=3125785 RepID=UPI00325600CD
MNDLFLSFIPGDSVLHRLDSRTKILGLMLASMFILKVSSFTGMSLLAFVFLSLVATCKIPLKHFFRSIRPMLIFFSLIFFMQLFFTEGQVIFQYRIISASHEGLVLGTVLTLRFVFLLLFAVLLTATTSPSKITAGIERLVRPLPLRYAGISSHDLAMMMSLSLYFVPLLYDSFKDLRESQLSRGMDIKKDPVKAIFSLAVPLVSTSLRSVTDVSLAMESRCYRGFGRTSVHSIGFKASDHLTIFLYVCLFFFYIAL